MAVTRGGLQEGAAVIQQPPVSHGRDTGRSAFLDALDVREVLVERERTSGEEQATRKRETGRVGNIWAGPEYCAGKASEPVEKDGDPGRAASDGWAHRYHPCTDSGGAKMNTRCPPKRVPSAARFFTHCELTMQPPQIYSIGGQRSSGQLTGKPAGARPDYRGRWCAVSRGHPG
ncbi:UNVERIFIED_CONTAM: hypothetical protein FKN15_024426 [Acipenser sinensis]